jgi:hypothetical protein
MRAIQQERFMADDGKGEQIAETTVAGERRYYTLETDFTLSSAPTRKWLNEEEQMRGPSRKNSLSSSKGLFN